MEPVHYDYAENNSDGIGEMKHTVTDRPPTQLNRSQFTFSWAASNSSVFCCCWITNLHKINANKNKFGTF